MPARQSALSPPASTPALRARALALLLPLVCASLPACIERPYDGTSAPQPAPVKAQVDRSGLKDVLIDTLPTGVVPVGAVFGNAVELVGYKAEPPEILPGERMRLTLYWRCKAELEPWHIFVHLDDVAGEGRIHAEHDPAGGRFPTEAWRAGDLVSDSFTFVAGRSPLNLFLGFYSQGETRLTLSAPGRGRDDGGNRLFAGLLSLAK
jgi:hypothetical protein